MPPGRGDATLVRLQTQKAAPRNYKKLKERLEARPRKRFRYARSQRKGCLR
jgi:hypothetical protein